MLLDGIKYKGNDIIRAYKNGSIIWNPIEYKFFNVSETTLTLLGPKVLPVSGTKDIEYSENVKFLLGQDMKDIAKKSIVVDASNLGYSVIAPGPFYCDISWHWDNDVNLSPTILTNFAVSLGKNSLLQEYFGAYFGGQLRKDLSKLLYRNLIFPLICHTPLYPSQSNDFLSLKSIDLKNLFSICTSFSQKLTLENIINIILDTSFYTSKSSNLKAKKELNFTIKTSHFADLAAKGYSNKTINFLIKDSLSTSFGKKLNGSSTLKIINLFTLSIPFSSNTKGLLVLQHQNASTLFSSIVIEGLALVNLLLKAHSTFHIGNIQSLKQKNDILFNASASNFSKSEIYNTYVDYLLTTNNRACFDKGMSIKNFVNEKLNFFYGVLSLSISEINNTHEETSIVLLGNQNLFNSFEKESFLFGTINSYNICKFGLNTNLVDFISSQKAKLIISSFLSLNEEDFLQFLQAKNSANFIFKGEVLFQNSIAGFYSLDKIITLTNLLTHQTKFLDNQEIYTFFTHENLEKTNLLSMFLMELVYSIRAKNSLGETKWKKAEIGWILTQSVLNNILDFTKMESFLINKNYSILTTSFIDLVLSRWLIFESRDIIINNKTIMQLDKWEYPIETDSPEGSDLFLSQVLSFSTIIV